MSYLRFSPKEYCAISLACQPLALDKMSLPLFKRILWVALTNRRPRLAERIAQLDESQVRILYDHLLEQRGNEAGDAGPQGFTTKELRVVAEACGSLQSPIRFLHPFKHRLVQLFQDVLPALACKLSSLSDSQFQRLYEHITDRKQGSS